LFAVAVPAPAEDDFANHVDVFPLTVSGHYSMLGEVGYHFSLWRVGKRIELGGAGLILDAYDTGDRTDGVNFIATVHLVSVALKRPDTAQKWWPSLGVQGGYNFNRHRTLVIIGFSVGFR
jgi:hypothetical protein